MTGRTPSGIAYDRAGPQGGPPLVLVHAGVADRRMWDPVWPALSAHRDVVRLDLRGYGDSSGRPTGALSPVDDVLDVRADLGLGPADLVGASFGAGVAVELALRRPEFVRSLVLSAPGGSLIGEVTPDLRAFVEAETSALARGDLDGAVEANLSWWVDGPGRDAAAPTVREQVRRMQRRAFEVTAGWVDVVEQELDPPARDRLTEIQAPTTVLVGELDLDAVQHAARRVAGEIVGARLVRWPGVAHLPSMERPDDFLALLREGAAQKGGSSGSIRAGGGRGRSTGR